MPSDDFSDRANALARQGLISPKAMQKLMGNVSPLEGGNVLPSPDPGPGVASAVPGVNMGEMRDRLRGDVRNLGNVGTPMDWAMAMAGGPSKGGLPMTTAARMARAAEQGYTVDAYKGMYPYDWRTVPERYGSGKIVPGTENRIPQEITSIDAYQTRGPGATGAGFFSNDPAVASRFANAMGEGAVYPVKLKMINPKVIDAQGRFAADFQFGKGAGQLDLPPDSPHDGVILKNTKDEGDVFIPRHAHQIRSRFAAFDPKNIGSKSLLAGVAGATISNLNRDDK